MRVLLLACNVGASQGSKEDLKSYLDHLGERIINSKADFVAIHFQELGGSNKDVGLINSFQPLLAGSLPGFTTRWYTRTNTDDISDPGGFTALGSMYAWKDSSHIQQWDFQEEVFKPVEDWEGSFVLTKFDGSSSRKGYLRTRWTLKGTELEMINIHNFHDADNTVAAEQSPSLYAEKRMGALDKLVRECNVIKSFPTFVFGDFNFRLELPSLVPDLESHSWDPDSPTGSQTKLKIEKKLFQYDRLSELMDADHSVDWLLRYDREKERVNALWTSRDPEGLLRETDITFKPTYPWCSKDKGYMGSRMVGYCDRVLVTEEGMTVMRNGEVQYGSVDTMPLGDHQPVFASFTL